MSTYRKPNITGPLSLLECEVLATVSAHSQATRALEVGHYLGLSTAVLLDSLPEGCTLTTIDHHEGDEHAPATSEHEFRTNITPYIGARDLTCVFTDMRMALANLHPSMSFDFVFYDADHSAAGVREFWALTHVVLKERCTLVFDDADWEEQSELTRLAEIDGFMGVRELPFVRYEQDKRHAETYTLEVMRREDQ